MFTKLRKRMDVQKADFNKEIENIKLNYNWIKKKQNNIRLVQQELDCV